MPHSPPRFNAYFIEPQHDGTFRFRSEDGGGKPHVCLNVDDRYGVWCEIVAWRVDNPSRWFLRYGDQTPILGAAKLAWANAEQREVALHGTPEGWIMAGMKGVCVIDWRVDLRELFVDVARVICESEELRRHLYKVLHQRDTRIKVSRQGQRARSRGA